MKTVVRSYYVHPSPVPRMSDNPNKAANAGKGSRPCKAQPKNLVYTYIYIYMYIYVERERETEGEEERERFNHAS